MTPHSYGQYDDMDMNMRKDEPNGGNYERKGITGNIFRCLDCGLEYFQSWIESHTCPAWPEKQDQQLSSGRYSLGCR
jgi:hypothetical protein